MLSPLTAQLLLQHVAHCLDTFKHKTWAENKLDIQVWTFLNCNINNVAHLQQEININTEFNKRTFYPECTRILRKTGNGIRINSIILIISTSTWNNPLYQSVENKCQELWDDLVNSMVQNMASQSTKISGMWLHFGHYQHSAATKGEKRQNQGKWWDTMEAQCDFKSFNTMSLMSFKCNDPVFVVFF